jgi:hypothetical protein
MRHPLIGHDRLYLFADQVRIQRRHSPDAQAVLHGNAGYGRRAVNTTNPRSRTLSSLEHIRKRPGMYIGRLGDGSHPDDGIYILLKEVLDNAVDEFIMGCGKRIDIAIDEPAAAGSAISAAAFRWARWWSASR